VSVSHGGVGQEEAFVGADGLGKCIWTLVNQDIAPTSELGSLWGNYVSTKTYDQTLPPPPKKKPHALKEDINYY
jgi:hypothetical protein